MKKYTSNNDIILTADNWKQVSMLFEKELLNKGIRMTALKTCMGEMILTLDSIFWSFKDVKSFEYPKTWKDAVKLRFFPIWLLTIFPASMTRITIKEVVPKLPTQYKSKLYAEYGSKNIPEVKIINPEFYDCKIIKEFYEK